MSTPATAADVQLAFYERFFLSKGLEPYPVQEIAFDHIFAGRNVMVTVPTGTGKTMMAKAAIHKALAVGQTAVYTTPLRALTEEKYRELCDDFGESKVGFATGDYKVNRDAPVQVQVAEILWNEVFGGRRRPADVVVMDEGHYFNDPERGYVWEQAIIGLDPQSQLVILSATVGLPKQFVQWVATTRQVQMELVESYDRKVPLYHEFREEYLIETVRELHAAGGTPAIVFVFGREQCFERARILKSCPRFTTEEERAEIAKRWKSISLHGGISKELEPLLLHGIGVHHAGILPRYKRLVEELTLERLVKFVVSTETIAAGINLPAKRVLFPSLRKHIKGQGRLLTSAEYHQMSGRAGRPQFDTEGIAISLAPEEVVQDIRKEIKDQKKGGRGKVDEAKIRRAVFAKAKADAQKKGDVIWDEEAHKALVEGAPAPLKSRTKVTPEMVLALGLPDLSTETPEHANMPPSAVLDARIITSNLLLPDGEKREAQKHLQMVIDNLRALGVVDEHGKQVQGEMIGKVRGMDALFVWYAMMNHPLDRTAWRELIELLVDHDVVHKKLSRKDDEKKRQWILERWREIRVEAPQTTWDDVEEEYDRQFPRELSPSEQILQEFLARIPHQELHGGKTQKKIWAKMEDENIPFLDFVEDNDLAKEEGSLFTYLARVMKGAKMLHEVTEVAELADIERVIRSRLSVIDERVLEDLW